MIAEPGTTHGTGRRRIGAARGIAALAAAALSLSACAAGQVAQTANEKATLDGTNVSVGNIDLRGLAILSPSGTSYKTGGNALLRVVLVNSGQDPDTLTGVRTDAATGWSSYSSLALAKSASAAAAGSPAPTGSQSVPLPPGGAVSYGTPDAKGGLVLTGLRTPKGSPGLVPGTTVQVTFTFEHAGTLTSAVPIQLSAKPGQDATIAPISSQPAG